ncbi:MAG: acyl-CoA dehydrogenase [Actinomycetota bacterium]|nr:acyl-CoA dehydrogenase [Actinomycetota bacterium]MDA2972677.1 acyl-CoA dehydrogenase [Actinomycetota bacterium]MDA3002310.1 acyl-CoA dehydrogenase [Actinomycetota bacterium]
MTDYRAPLTDIDFVLNRVCGLDRLLEMPGYTSADSAMVRDLLAEAARFMEEKLAPLNRVGDTFGVKRDEAGNITTAPGFREAYQAYVDAGWGAVPFDEGFGGGGFPWMVGIAIQEMMTASNMAFSMCPLLTQGAIDAIAHHGSEEQKMTYLPKMITGEWTGTMNLTEPDAGSDVGAVRIKAVPQSDGSYLISGTKIYISFGEHDMADNIVHLVLARTPDAPPGTKGISCFIVPKFLLNADGSLGQRNDITCVSVEHKLGIHASPTCVLSFGDGDGAVGYLIGEENRGMQYMFTMMNQARLSVGLQGLALGDRAYQQSLQYARDRRQGRAPGAPAGAASPIIDHPDVKRMLLTMKTTLEALRRLTYWNAACLDVAAHHPDAAEREWATDLAALLTPLSKGWGTDMAVELTGLAVQIHGGMGFVEETGVAQHYRDARITTIYEGTNGIQAIDLVGRKIGLRGGAVIVRHLDAIDDLCTRLDAHPDLEATASALRASVAATRSATTWLAEHGSDPVAMLSGATPYLRLLSTVTGGFLLAESALIARDQDLTADVVAERVASARFFCEQLMPATDGLVSAVTGDPNLLMTSI